MDITHKVPPVNPNTAVQSVKPVKKIDPRPQAAVAQSDRVELSDQARTIRDARLKINQMADVDAQRVARIKAELAAGTYRPDSRKTADRMIAESLLNDLD